MKTLLVFTDRCHHEYRLVEVDEDRQNLLVGILLVPSQDCCVSDFVDDGLGFALGKRRLDI
jgi:hypothetical protein